MTGAMYAAVAGLKAHMSALNVIGNNIANINTNAYKAARYVFDEAIYTNIKSGTNGTLTTGGQNPSQIGYGANVGTVDIDMSTKNYNPTSSPLDVTIDGDGFLLVGDKDLTFETANDFTQLSLTRLGDLRVDPNGFLVDHAGNVVYGWLEVAPEDGETGVNNGGETVTSRLLTPLRVPMKDTNDQVVWPVEGEATGAGISYNGVSDAGIGDAVDGAGGADGATVRGRGTLSGFSISANGQLTGTTEEGETIVVGYIALGKVDNPQGVTHVDGRYYKAMEGAGDLHLCTMGKLESLLPTSELEDADVEDVLAIEATTTTSLVTNGLESSGTELATEISNMIMMQRGYQANTRIITVTDSMLEELVNMKR